MILWTISSSGQGPDHLPAAVFRYKRHQESTKKLYYAYDSLGSVASLSDRQGHTAIRYRYDSFGELTEGDISENEYTYTGQRLDPESKLYHFHFRQYDAAAGVWTTIDPIGILGGLNLYQYVKNNPLKWIDPLGLEDADTIGGMPGNFGGDKDIDGDGTISDSEKEYNDYHYGGNGGNDDNGGNGSCNLPEVVVTAKRVRGRIDGGRNDDNDKITSSTSKTVFTIYASGAQAIGGFWGGTAIAKTNCIAGESYTAYYAVVGTGLGLSASIKTKGFINFIQAGIAQIDNFSTPSNFNTQDRYPPSYVSYLDTEVLSFDWIFGGYKGIDLKFSPYKGGIDIPTAPLNKLEKNPPYEVQAGLFNIISWQLFRTGVNKTSCEN